MHYYVDGYNVMHKATELRPLVRQSFLAAREALIEKVAQFCVATGTPVTLVFDGQAKHTAEHSVHEHVGGLRIVYAPANSTADAVIERTVYQAAAKLETVVVSNDRSVREVCRNMGAIVIEADNFLTTLREAKRDTQALINHTQRVETSVLEERLDARSIEALKTLRDKL